MTFQKMCVMRNTDGAALSFIILPNTDVANVAKKNGEKTKNIPLMIFKGAKQ